MCANQHNLRFSEVDFGQLQFGKNSMVIEGKAVVFHSCYSAALKEKLAYKLYREPVNVKAFWNELLFLRYRYLGQSSTTLSTYTDFAPKEIESPEHNESARLCFHYRAMCHLVGLQ